MKILPTKPSKNCSKISPIEHCIKCFSVYACALSTGKLCILVKKQEHSLKYEMEGDFVLSDS